MAGLTLYEARQVAEIAAWKSERPSRLAESIRRLSRPFAKVVATIVRPEVIRRVVESAEAHAREHDPLDEPGAAPEAVARDRPLEAFDALAASVGARTGRAALVQGVAPTLGALVVPLGSLPMAIVEVPMLLRASIGAIRRIGHCYGEPLDDEEGRRVVLDVLDLANTHGPRARRAGSGRGRDGVEAIEDSMVADLPIEAVPIIGDLAPLVLDYAFLSRVEVAARRVFQERWLRDRGKVGAIAPSPVRRRRSPLKEAAVVAGRLGYAGGYAAGFGVTFPASLVGAGLSRLLLGPAVARPDRAPAPVAG